MQELEIFPIPKSCQPEFKSYRVRSNLEVYEDSGLQLGDVVDLVKFLKLDSLYGGLPGLLMDNSPRDGSAGSAS